uniref:Large ribosomal subunit protein uL24c n=1 Tax=Acrosorium ciliolatum TaxID=1550622 RepID=A0A1Z1M1T6_9FLOR|nr:ribosomal protein L24 [Acrosorium ciliolatum]ARW60047.1 ribosomal protein L24 [Acrosorium ciliolatum]
MKKKINLKTGETVQIISGKYKNQTGKIKKIFINKNSLIIENLNIKTKHVKPKQTEENGKIAKIEAPIHRSNARAYIISK